MYNDENIQDGLHVIPEEVGECDLNRGDGENIIHYLSDKDTCEDLLDDWDEDDQESGPYIFQYVIDIDGNYGTLETISNAKNEIGAKEIRYGGYTVQLTPSGFGDFAERCTQSCEQKAEEDLNQYLDEPIITNDGINDNIQKLFCKLKLNAIKNPSDVITHYEVQALPSSPDDCMVAEEETIQFPFDNINDPYERGETVTMDYPEKKSVFYATPETYGYLKTLGNSYTAEYGSWDNFKPVLGGEADFSFYIETEGSNCRDDSIGNFEVKLISTDLPEPEYNLESEEPLIIPDQIKTMDLFTGTLEDLYIECSDQCIWTLNEEDTEPGNLHAGDNLIKVRVNNIKDPAVYSNAVFKFKGEGLHVGGNQFVPSAPGGSSSGSSVVGGGTFYDPGYTGTTSAGGTFQTPLGKPVDFQISGSCGDAAEQAIKGVMELQCKYADVGDAYDPTCSGGLSCAQFVDWAFVNGMGLDEVWANGNGWCDVASMEKLGNDNKFQPGDVFSQDFGSVGHAGMIIGKGKVSNLVSSSYTTRNGQQMCYTQFKPDSGGEVVYAHSYGWISGGVAHGRACFTPQSVFEKAFSDVKTVYCRRDVCS